MAKVQTKSKSDIKVTVHCITYNHEKYIAQALDGFLMQKTTFAFEVIVHDDKSTDKTTKILRDYEKRFPDIIKPVYEKENQWSKNNDSFIKDMFLASQGTYIAECEGDDYWSDEYKLQKQFDYMEAHPDCALSFHPVKVVFEAKDKADSIFPTESDRSQFTVKNLIKSNYIQSNSVMYRKQSYKDMPTGIMPLDWYMHLYHARFGGIGFLDDVMSVYRRHEGGIWWEARGNLAAVWERFGLKHLAMYVELLKLYDTDDEYRDLLNEHVAQMVKDLPYRDRNTGLGMLQAYRNTHTHNSDLRLMLKLEETNTPLYDMLEEQGKIIAMYKDKLERCEAEFAEAIKDRDIYSRRASQLEGELTAIKSTKMWRMRHALGSKVRKDKKQ